MTLTEDIATISLHDILRPEILPDPYPFYRRLRETNPVYWDATRETWVLTR